MIVVDMPGLALANEASDVDPYLSDLIGWEDTTETMWDLEQIPAGKGTYDDDVPEEAPRNIVVVGELTAIGTDLHAVRRSLAALKALSPFTLTVTGTNGPLSAKVRVNGKILFRIIDERGVARFEIPLVAIDPRKYGPTQTVSTGLPTSGGGLVEPVVEPLSDGIGGDPGRITLTNSGTTDTIPELHVSGGLREGFELICIEKGARIRLERLIPDGSTVSIDMAEGQAWIDGQSPISGDLIVSEWWRIEPGETVTVQFVGLGTVTGTPTLTAVYASAES